ncbi:MAG: type II secretion system F family protein [Candidatus Lindowbacteria bacterium]|nr:type II secretion system F family protein [Candidatus Lindowbacteria bacterium]
MRGSIVAEDETHAKKLLRESGLIPISLNQDSFEKIPKLQIGWLTAFCRQLGTLLRAGFPLDRALVVLAASSSDQSMTSVLGSVDEGVRNGLSLSDSFLKAFGQGQSRASRTASGAIRGQERSVARQGLVNEFSAMIEAGEESGDLAVVLLRYSELLERRNEFRRRVKGALMYPLIVSGIATAVVLFLFVYVLPTITKLFEGTKAPLPIPTQILFFLADVTGFIFWPVLIIGTLVLIFGRKYFASEKFRANLERWTLSLPGIGPTLELAAVARWARTFSSLLVNGVEILKALDLAGRSAQSYRLGEAIKKARPRVAEGLPLGRALEETGAFPPIAIEAVTVGENSGALAELLEDMSIGWESEVESSAERFSDLIEPLVLVVMGIIVGGIVLAILLPIFELNSGLK